MNDIDRELREQWFTKASNDIRAAEMLLAAEEPPFDVVCFHCQQAAEKYLKGLLAGAGIAFPPVHDLGRLITELASHGFPADHLREPAESLNPYAVEVRYPETLYVPEDTETRQALDAALVVRNWVLERGASMEVDNTT